MNSQPIILLIEDNLSTQKLFQTALEAEGYKVVGATDGAAALRELESVKPDLILQDLFLPDIGHMELNHQLRSHPNGEDVSILALAGFLNKSEETQYNDEFAAFLIKPIEISRLIEIVKVYLPNKVCVFNENTNGRRILIVDDNRSQLKLLRLQLNHQGFEIHAAENGKEALQLIRKYIPDAVVSDVLMPGMDGFELCLEIRRIPAYAHIPIILMTSQFLEESDREMAKKIGANYYITRTPEADKLIAILHECLSEQISVKSKIPQHVELFKEEHTHRLIRQLERQIDVNAGLAQRCALQFAHLSMLGEIANALTNSLGIEKTFEHVLATCLDAAGISRGALYLVDSENNMVLEHCIGFESEKIDKLEKLFEDEEILSDILSTKDIVKLPAAKLPFETEVGFAMLAPLVADSQCLGVLLLGSKTTNIESIDSTVFARSLASQIGQAVALSRAFEQARMNDKLATIGTLAAGVAHEINNPVTWVMNNLISLRNNMSTLKKTIPSNQVNVISEFDDMISESLQGVERIRDIVKNLKGFSRMDVAEKTAVNIHDVLNMTINMASLEFKYRARIEKDFTRHAPVTLASSGKLQQVFLNLIINASQAIPEGQISKNVIRIKTEVEDQYIRVDIIDTGHGIPPDILPYIFDPFFTTKPAGHGTGLGLSICREILSQLEGKIGVKSTLNKGSIFTVYLPVYYETQVKQVPVVETLISGHKKKVLIVDDEPYLLKSLLNILKNNSNDYEAVTALGGMQASELLELHGGRFDAIICDLQMPDMNGADLYQYVVKNYPSLEKRIIFITGGSYTPKLNEFLANTGNLVLEKPFAKEELFQSMQACFSAA